MFKTLLISDLLTKLLTWLEFLLVHTHLCIPINSNWQLDGVSLIPDCIGIIINEIDGKAKGLIKITDILEEQLKLQTIILFLYL